jgi:adenosine deaminase
MARIEKTVFISYRRTDQSWGQAIFQDLTQHGYDVFIDYEGIASGNFETVILENIRARAHFLVLLTPTALERSSDPEDWMRREIEAALDSRRNIVPVMLAGFDFGAAATASQLTGKLAELKKYNGLEIPKIRFFSSEMERLRTRFLNVPVDAVLHPASDSAQQVAKEQKDKATMALGEALQLPQFGIIRGFVFRHRRIVLAVILVICVIFVVRFAMVVREFDTVVANARFEVARAAGDLPAFLRRMPKGGDLHTHLSGAVDAERLIAWAAQEDLCFDRRMVLLPKPQCDGAGAVPVSDAMRDQQLYNRLVDALSMRGFKPTLESQTGHDQFYATFERFGTVSGSHFIDMMLDQLKKYDRENVQYVEFMVSSSCPNDRDRFVKAVSEAADDASKLAALEANGLAGCVAARRNDLTAAIGKITTALACDVRNAEVGCGVTFRYIIQINRNNSPDEVFVQTAVAAALIRAEPRMVGLNLVGPEDSLVARRDYTRHMQIIRFLAKDVPVALHAGELWPGLVPSQDLTFHIRQAVEITYARRIGQGVALLFEHDMEGLLAQMRARPVAVEINLTSNDLILGVRGKDHPLPTYLAAGVPVVLSTDDAGILRIDLTNEYLRAARDYKLSYRTVKTIARNALNYSFLDEEKKRSELQRFDRSIAEFERSVASGRPLMQNLLALIKATVTPLP